MMLSFFNASTKKEVYQQISGLFQLTIGQISNQLELLINNEQYVQNGESVFPPHLVVEYKYGMKTHKYKYTDFLYNDIDLTMSRFDTPIDIICNLTLRCATSCIYCYADRKGNQNKHMSIDLVSKIITEANNIGVIRFKLMGGEIMLYEGWEDIVSKLITYNYQPDISIKRPLSEKDIVKWKELKAETSPIQISFDTAIKDHLYKILKVQDPYYKNIVNTFDLLEKYQINYIVHTVINQFNDNVDDIKSLSDFFKGRKYLKKWVLDAAKCSMYNGLPYSKYKTSLHKINAINDYIDQLNRTGDFPFKLQYIGVPLNHNEMSQKKKQDLFSKRNMCSGNLTSLYILPDGKVTICEELYWHPRFIIGDLTKQSILEIWNSDKARELFYLKQDTIPKDSPCSICEEFPECRKYKHICWRDTILGYGANKWYYPDLTCPKAPAVRNDIFIKN